MREHVVLCVTRYHLGKPMTSKLAKKIIEKYVVKLKILLNKDVNILEVPDI